MPEILFDKRYFQKFDTISGSFADRNDVWLSIGNLYFLAFFEITFRVKQWDVIKIIFTESVFINLFLTMHKVVSYNDINNYNNLLTKNLYIELVDYYFGHQRQKENSIRAF